MIINARHKNIPCQDHTHMPGMINDGTAENLHNPRPSASKASRMMHGIKPSPARNTCQIGTFTDTRHKNPAQNVHALAS
jgi:hypothetical protein